MKKEEFDEDQIALDAFNNPAELYRLWKEEGNGITKRIGRLKILGIKR